jgi:hypothetical protein
MFVVAVLVGVVAVVETQFDKSVGLEHSRVGLGRFDLFTQNAFTDGTMHRVLGKVASNSFRRTPADEDLQLRGSIDQISHELEVTSPTRARWGGEYRSRLEFSAEGRTRCLASQRPQGAQADVGAGDRPDQYGLGGCTSFFALCYRSVRADKRFMPFVARLGLVDYWIETNQ